MSMTLADAQHCRATRKDGTPCQGKATASGYCFAHDASAAANRAKGGRNRSGAARSLKRLPERLRPVADKLALALDEVYSGRLEPRRASAMAAVAGALLRVVQTGELEERVRALEAAAREADARAVGRTEGVLGHEHAGIAHHETGAAATLARL